MEPIQINGIDQLTAEDKALANKLVNEYYEKIARMLKNEVNLVVDFKKYEKNGKDNKKTKASIHVKARSSTNIFEADVADWDFAKTIHKAMNKLENEIEKKLHVSDQHPKTRR